MSSRSLTALYLPSLEIILLNIPLTMNAAAAASIPRIYITDVVERKHLLNDYSRRLQWGASEESSPSANPPLTAEQFDNCLYDEALADTNMDFELDESEYLTFLSINSARYGYPWEYPNQVTFVELPLEFPMLFHSTACLCAYEEGEALPHSLQDVDFGCCEGKNEHIVVSDNVGLFGDMTDDEYAYSRLFCTEAFYLYPAVLTTAPIVTTMPTFTPSTDPPTTLEPSISPADGSTTTVPTIAESIISPTDGTPTTVPTIAESSISPTDGSATAVPTIAESSISPTDGSVTTVPTESIISPTDGSTTTVPTIAESSISPTDGSATTVPTEFSISPTDGSTTAVPTIAPETDNVTTTDTPTTSSSTGVMTLSPTGVVETDSPAAVDNGLETDSPVDTPSPTFPVVFPTMSPTVNTDDDTGTGSPTFSSSSTSTDLEIEIQYDYNSDCGVTADDVMSGNDGISIKEGLSIATEAIVVGILNSTYPRDDDSSLAPTPGTTADASDDSSPAPTPETTADASDDSSPAPTPGTTADANGSSSSAPTPGTTADATLGGTLSPSGLVTVTTSTSTSTGTNLSPISASTSATDTLAPAVTRSGTKTSTQSFLRGVIAPSRAGDEDPSVRTSEESLEAFVVLRTSADGLLDEPSKLGLDNKDSNNRRRGLAMLLSGLRRRRHPSNELGQQPQRHSRLLVYYTQTNPVVITDVEDVIDSCPSGFTCMRVISKVTVTLEEGDDPEQVEEVIRIGFEDSILDASFFEALPADTVMCPVDDNSSPAPTTGVADVPGESLIPTSPSSFASSAGTTSSTTLASSAASVETASPTPSASSDETLGSSLSPTLTGSDGTLSPSGLAEATTLTTSTAVAGSASSTLAPTGASGVLPTTIIPGGGAAPTLPPMVTPTKRDGGGEMAYHQTMMDTGSIHSEKLRLEYQPT